MVAFEIFFVFLIIVLVIVVFYYYQGLFCGMCLDCVRDCRTCCDCDRKTDDYNRVKSVTTDELSEEELSEEEFSDEETIVRSPEISNFKKLSLGLHF
jgi:MFS superfamily sulfate permease-like transporter